MSWNLLSGQTVAVTGGAGLLGAAFVEAIARHGGHAVILDTEAGHARTLEERLCSELGAGAVSSIPTDITSCEALDEAIEAIVSRRGSLDALVNNAYPRNANYGRPFFETTYEDFAENVSWHLGGYFLASQRAATRFKLQGYGNIINIASVYGVVAPSFEIYRGTSMTLPVEYAAIKSAVIHLTKYMARLFRGTGIRVNAISPGGVQVDQPESFLEAYRQLCLSKGMLDARDVEGALLFLLSPGSRYVNGQNLIVDDGMTL